MSTTGGADGAADGRWSRRLLAGALLCLVAAGGLLWWGQGAAVFSSLVGAAIAWCF